MKRIFSAGSILILLVIADAAIAQQAVPAVPGRVEAIYGPFAPIVRAVADTLKQLLLVALFAAPLQALWPAIRRPVKFRSYEFWLDLVYWFQGIWLALFSFYALVDVAVGAMYGTGIWFPWLRELPFWAQVLASIWAFDFLVYWRHRWEHEFAVLWSFHAVHHTAEQVDFLTTTRLHPFEVALGMLFNAMVIKLGLHPGPSTLGFAIYLYYNYFIHTNLRLRYPGVLKFIFVSPFMHHWHHAKDEVAMGKNLGVIFAWNDWLFGTAYHPARWPAEFGLAVPPSQRVSQSYLRHLVYPLQYFISRARAWRAARAA
ncbi:MAG: sterol desaturase family protein [Gammaproteobacteria bacterium]|nr:sterol desaturase family protein [Gammaproteobacteria bacterium]